MVEILNSKTDKCGIILAAGMGERVCNSNKNVKAKPLVNVNNLSLLLRTIKSHEVAGCKKIIIVLGWQAELIEKYVLSEYKGPIQIKFVYNEQYKLKNGISVLCAKPFIQDEFVLTMADHVLDDRIMRMLTSYAPPEDGAALCVDYKLYTIFDMHDATKVLTNKDKIKKIGKKIESYNCIDTGVFVSTYRLIDALETIYAEKGDVSLSEGVQLLADENKMEAIDIGDSFWQDVDTPEMLAHAEEILKKK